MADLSAFPITQKWVPQNPDVLQLFSFPTPNGVKASIALEETGIPYEAHKVTLADADVKSPEFLSLNPNNKIPAIIDPDGPDGQPIGLFESGAILIYLAEKTGMLIGETAADKAKTIQWLMFQMGGLGPMLGQMGFFVKFAGSEWEDKRPQDRYVAEGNRLLAALDKELADKDWIIATQATQLTDHYRYARMIERRVQMVQDAQTHTLPRNEEGFNRLAAMMDADADSLRDTLRTRLSEVRRSLNGPVLFSLTDGALTGTDVRYQIRRARAAFRPR